MSKLPSRLGARGFGLAVAALIFSGLCLFLYIGNKRPAAEDAVFESLSELQNELEIYIPDGTTLKALQAYLETKTWECSGIANDVIYCALPAPPQGLWVGRKWLIEFQLEGETVQYKSVKEGLVGP